VTHRHKPCKLVEFTFHVERTRWKWHPHVVNPVTVGAEWQGGGSIVKLGMTGGSGDRESDT